jgi:N-acetylneuraminic acid mutarotase
VEVIHQILEKLPVRTLSVVSRVSRVLYNSCQDERLWRKEIIKCEQPKKGFSPPPSPMSSPSGSPMMEESEVAYVTPTSRLCHIAVTWGGYMWIHGGHNTHADSQTFNEIKNDLWRYKFEDKQWERVHVESGCALPAKTEHSAVIYQNKMYLFGGYSGEYFTNTLYAYDFEKNECTHVVTSGDVPSVRSAHVGVVYQDKMYIFGGWNGAEQNNDLYSYDFATSRWAKIVCNGPVPRPRCSHAGSVSDRFHSMFIFAGYGGKDHGYLNDLCQFDFETLRWKLIERTPPIPRSRMRLVEFQDKIYIYGGWNKVEHFNNLYQYDLECKRWSEVQLDLEPAEGKIGQHSMVVHNNILYIFSGYNSRTKSSTNDLYAYRLSKPHVTPMAPV